MKLKSLAIAASLAVASVVAATPSFAATLPSTVTESVTTGSGFAQSAIFAGWYNTWSATYAAIASEGYYTTSFGATPATANFTSDFSAVFLALVDGAAYTQTYVYTASNTTATYTAVPGPEAGAGIGALALAGAAYLVARRRKDVKAA